MGNNNCNTITTVNELRSQLNKTRINGYTFEREENALDVCSITVPVRDYTNKMVVAVNIVRPIQRNNSKPDSTCKEYRKINIYTDEFYYID